MLCETNQALNSLLIGLVFYLGFTALCLFTDVLKHLSAALIGRRVLHCQDNILIVEVFLTEEVDIGATLVLRVVAVGRVVAFAALAAFGLLLLLLGNAK